MTDQVGSMWWKKESFFIPSCLEFRVSEKAIFPAKRAEQSGQLSRRMQRPIQVYPSERIEIGGSGEFQEHRLCSFDGAKFANLPHSIGVKVSPNCLTGDGSSLVS